MESTLQTYGRLRSSVVLVFTACIAMCIASFGIYTMVHKPKFNKKTTGKAKDVSCTSNVCTANVTAEISGQSYTASGLKFPSPPETKNDSDVTVYYDNKNNLSSTTDSFPKFLGPSLLSSAICMVCVSFIIYYAVSRSNTAATLYGGYGAIHNIASTLKN